MYFLGIDGGGTKTKFILCDDKGLTKAEYTNETSHYLQVGLDGLTSCIEEGLKNISKLANIQITDISYAYMGDAGYGDVKSECPMIEAAIAKGMHGIKFSVVNDCEVALAGALALDDGINIVAGTGSIGVGHSNKTNTTLTCGGWHHGIGSDEGSGYWLAYQLLHRFTRQADGRDPKTALYDVLYKKLELEEDGQLISRVVEEWNLDRTKVASLAPIVKQLCELNDPNGYEIFDRAANELADIIITLYRRLEFTGDIKVSYTGGIFKNGEVLLSPLRNILAKYHMELAEPILPPDKGAVLLAMKACNININEEVINNLKK